MPLVRSAVGLSPACTTRPEKKEAEQYSVHNFDKLKRHRNFGKQHRESDANVTEWI